SSVSKAPTMVVVIGVPEECSVLDLKSRFEAYGPISRTRMEPGGVAYVNFRSSEAAQSAVAAAQDSSFPVTLHSIPVQVLLGSSSDQVLVGRRGDNQGLFSRLVRGEVPLRRQGRRGNSTLVSTVVKPKEEEEEGGGGEISSGLQGGFKGREIVGYDD
ncbi:homeobox transcription factor, partial [Genlisea aurea]